MEANISLLRAKWEEALLPYEVNGVMVEAVFADLVMRYGTDGRYYHNLYHIQNVLAAVETMRDLATDYTAVQLAAWFHDVIYHMQFAAGEASNERQSADYAANILCQMNISPDTISLIHQLICATQLNAPAPNDPNFHVILDADLATLAADSEEYAHYSKAIRREYAFVPEDAYRNGRCQVLQSFLDRDRIFLTQRMFEQKEAAARLNIQREIDELRPKDV